MSRQSIATRFMRATRTADVFDALVDEHGMGVVCADEIAYDEALFSNGFLSAVDAGRLPILGSHRPSFESKMDQEYHHMIVGDECFAVYFTA
jgi:hypothetical protein